MKDCTQTEMKIELQKAETGESTETIEKASHLPDAAARELESRENDTEKGLPKKIGPTEEELELAGLKGAETGRRFTRVFIILLLTLFGHSLIASAQSIKSQQQSVITAVRTDSKIVIDGKVEDREWSDIPTLALSQKVPNAGDPPTQDTEIRIAYDDNFLYLSGRMFDNEPEKIVANTKKRDDFTENTGWCGFLIDSYNDRENALAFFVTPTGSKLDMALSNDIQGAGAFNLSWNSYWDAASSRDERGWFAEIRIPFSSLPFEVKDDEVIMGITVWRYLARNDETDIFPARGLETGSSFKPSLTQRFSFESISESRTKVITPYILGGAARTSNLIDDRVVSSSDFKKEIGLDAKFSLGSNTTIDISLNTDFAQVEADDQQVNLSRLNLFFPEKRLFFQERAGLFDFNFGSFDKLFHSRRIGIVNGQQTRIFGGLRAIGKRGAWEGGFLSMQTDSRESLNAENFSILRLKRNVLNENSKLGLIVTHRGDFQGDFNLVYGLDGDLRWWKQNFLSYRWAQSFSDGLANRIGSQEGSKYYIELANRSQDGLVYNVNLGRSGEDYLPGIGFEHRYNFKKLASQFSYNIFPSRESKISLHGPYANADVTWGNQGNVVESQFVSLGYNVLSKSGYTFDISGLTERENLLAPLPLTSSLIVPSGDYTFGSVVGLVASPSSGRLSYAANISIGNFYNGSRTSLLLNPVFNLTPDILLEGKFEINKLNIGEQSELIQISSLKTLMTFSTKLSLSTQVQHNSVAKSFLGSLRLRFNPRDGDDFYIVFNGDLNQDRDRRNPWLPISNQGTAFVKYSRTWR